MQLQEQPKVQEYRNPLRWGWYYVERPDGTTSGLMTKGSARKLLKDNLKESYGFSMGRHTRAPKNLFRYFTFPLKTG